MARAGSCGGTLARVMRRSPKEFDHTSRHLARPAQRLDLCPPTTCSPSLLLLELGNAHAARWEQSAGLLQEPQRHEGVNAAGFQDLLHTDVLIGLVR